MFAELGQGMVSLVRNPGNSVTDAIIDVIAALTDSPRARKYWNALKTKLMAEGSELSPNMGQLKSLAEDGTMRMTDVADTEQLFRLIQSIPSPKAEPFKLCLAQ